MAVIATAQYLITARDSASRIFKESGKNASLSLRSVARVARTSAFAIGAVAGATLLASKTAIAYADNLGKQARAIGVSSEALQAYRLAFQDAGNSEQDFDVALRKLNQRLGEAYSGILPSARIAFEKLGVAVQNNDGTIRKSGDVFKDLSAVVRDAGSAAEVAGELGQILGRRWEGVFKTFNNNGDVIGRYTDIINTLGITIDEDLIEQSERAQSALDVTGQVIRGQFTNAFATLAPEIENASKNITVFLNQAKNFGGVIGAYLSLAETNRYFAGFLSLLTGVGHGLSSVGITGVQAFKALAFAIVGDFAGAGDALDDLGTKLSELNAETNTRLTELFSNTNNDELKAQRRAEFESELAELREQNERLSKVFDSRLEIKTSTDKATTKAGDGVTAGLDTQAKDNQNYIAGTKALISGLGKFTDKKGKELFEQQKKIRTAEGVLQLSSSIAAAFAHGAADGGLPSAIVQSSIAATIAGLNLAQIKSTTYQSTSGGARSGGGGGGIGAATASIATPPRTNINIEVLGTTQGADGIDRVSLNLDEIRNIAQAINKDAVITTSAVA